MRRIFFLLALLMLIAACGGGSDDNDDDINVVNNSQPTVRNFPTSNPTQPFNLTPSVTTAPTSSFGSVNPTTNCPIPTGWQGYIVSSGDTLGALADSIGSTVATLQTSNCISTEIIFVGQLLFLPSLPIGVPTVNASLYTGGSGVTFATSTNTPISTVVQASCNVPPGWVAYSVQAGDTLGDLATRTTTTVGNLQNGNCLANSEIIFVGQVLYLPRLPDSVTANPGTGGIFTPTPNTSCAIPLGWTPYTVVAGDTLGVLADTYGTTVEILQNGNCLVSSEIIFVGQIIYVPSGIAVPTAAPTLTPIVNIGVTSTPAPIASSTVSIGGSVPAILPDITVRPTLVRDDGVLVTLQQEIALDVGVVLDADSVTYFAQTTPTDPNPVQVGQDLDPFDGTQFVYTFNNFDSELYFYAVAQNQFGTSTSALVRVVYDPTYALGSGAPDIAPFIGFDGSIYNLQANATVSVSWLNFPQTATRIDFFLNAGGQVSVLGTDTNLSDGARISWQVPSSLNGQVYAIALTSDAQSVESDRVNVFVQGSGN